MTIPGIWAGPKNKNGPTVVGAHSFLQGIAYQNSTWFVKREMQEKEPKLASALERGALSGNSNTGWYGDHVAFGGALIAGSIGEIVGQQTPVLASLFETHVHDFEGHVLGAVVAHQRSGLQVPHADRQLQLHLRARREVSADGRNAAAQAGGLDFQRKILLQVRADGADRSP